MNFFPINSDFDRPERKGHGAKVPGSEMARERKGEEASWPGSESARVLLADSLWGANWPGSEKARYRSSDGTDDGTRLINRHYLDHKIKFVIETGIRRS